MRKNFARSLLQLSALLWALWIGGCQDKPWDPELAALVNGQPISKAAVIRIMELGFYPLDAQSSDRLRGAASVMEIVKSLVDETLILQKAQESGLKVEAQELAREMERVGSAWPETELPPAELAELKQSLHNQLLIARMTEKIMKSQRRLTAEKWRRFWAQWPRQPLARYQVRILFLPPERPEPKLPPASAWRSLETLARHFQRQNMETLISAPIWLEPQALDKAPLAEALAQAAASGSSFTRPLRLEESWAVYELLEAQPAPEPAAYFRQALEEFERQAEEEAFQSWLNQVRSESEVRINPVFLEMES